MLLLGSKDVKSRPLVAHTWLHVGSLLRWEWSSFAHSCFPCRAPFPWDGFGGDSGDQRLSTLLGEIPEQEVEEGKVVIRRGRVHLRELHSCSAIGPGGIS